MNFVNNNIKFKVKIELTISLERQVAYKSNKLLERSFLTFNRFSYEFF